MPMQRYIHRREFLELLFTTAAASISDGKSPAAARVDSSAVLPWERSGLPYNAPRFGNIRDADYKPAILTAIARQRKQIEDIAQDPNRPSLENTIAALERATGTT